MQIHLLQLPLLQCRGLYIDLDRRQWMADVQIRTTLLVQFSNLSYVDAVVQSTCGSADGEITLTASDGVIAYQYSIDNGASFQASGNFTGLLAGNYNVVVQDNIGCQVDWNCFSNRSRWSSNK